MWTVTENANNPIEHPLPFIDEGRRFVNLENYHPYISNKELSEIILNVNLRTVDSGFQKIRRAINILERPLYSTNGKSYIYSNYNPKYEHQLLTIFRTLYNFVWEQSYSKKNKIKMTPAQRVGLVDKKFDYKDIIYFR